MRRVFIFLFLSCYLLITGQAQELEYSLKNYNEHQGLIGMSEVTITESGDTHYYRIRDEKGGEQFVSVLDEIFQDSIIYTGQSPSEDFKLYIDFKTMTISKHAKK